MQSQKSRSHRLFLWKNIFIVSASFFASFLGLSFNSNEVSALLTPTLSSSVDQTAVSVNGNQVINSTEKTTEIPLNLTVNTDNKTGYTATLNSETNETALVNNESTTGAKINSISSTSTLSNFSNNTWGVKVGNATSFSPIPKLASPINIIQTAGKTNGDETNSIKIGMKLSDNLESGRYTNKLVISILTNNYNYIAIMIEGPDFNTKLNILGTSTNKVEHFKKSPVAPAASMNAVNIEDEDSDYEIKLWLDPTDKTAYYYTEPEKVYLNENSVQMFFFNTFAYPDDKMVGIPDIDLSNFDTSKVTNMSHMFYGMRNLISLNLSNFDTSKVTNMSHMFRDMSSLTTLNLSSFDTSKVTNMRDMFYSMRSLTTLNLSNFDTSKVTDMSDMFTYMSSLTTLNLSSFDTSKVTNMGAMFEGMSGLTTLNLSNFDTSRVTDMGVMFSGMSNLTTLDLSHFNTSQVANMEYMFAGMSNLTTLDLSNFDTSQVTSVGYMFSLSYNEAPMDKLEKIYVNNDFDTANVTYSWRMFENRKQLRGGNGSYLADPSTADESWLRIDDPAHGRPGYFTRKP